MKSSHDYSQLRTMYEDQLLSIDKIAEKLGVSGTTIHHQLRTQGIDTSKRLRQVLCACGCGKKLKRNRAQIRNQQNFFYNKKHYLKALEDPEYSRHRQNQRAARIVFESCVGTLDFNPVIHHVDGKDENNSPKNLLGFRSQADYKTYLGGGKIEALKADTGAWEEVKKDD